MRLIFDDVTVTDADDNDHTVSIMVIDYIPPLPATQWEHAQHEIVEWVFCDRTGRYVTPPCDISEREAMRIDEWLIEQIAELKSGSEEP